MPGKARPLILARYAESLLQLLHRYPEDRRKDGEVLPRPSAYGSFALRAAVAILKRNGRRPRTRCGRRDLKLLTKRSRNAPKCRRTLERRGIVRRRTSSRTSARSLRSTNLVRSRLTRGFCFLFCSVLFYSALGLSVGRNRRHINNAPAAAAAPERAVEGGRRECEKTTKVADVESQPARRRPPCLQTTTAA